MASSNDDSQHLIDIYADATRLYHKIESSDLASNSSQYQEMILQCIAHLQKVADRVNQLGVFSNNEDMDDVTTIQLRYFIVHALLADLSLKIQNSTLPDARLNNINIAKNYTGKYLQLCRDYGLFDGRELQLQQQDDSLPDNQSSVKMSTMAQLKQDTDSRHTKIQRFRQLKEQEKKMKIIEKLMQQDKYQLDEETIRQYRILQIQSWINKSLDSLDSMDSEMKILVHMIKMKESGKDTTKENVEKKKPVAKKPLVITREMIKNKVFGAGYPSLPTMSQEELLEKEIREGKVVLEYNKSLQTTSNKTNNIEEDQDDDTDDDDESIQKAREWDDWKDTHKRGWGNRMNRG